MQKPSKLAQTPQIRFAGFTDPWERRKLDKIADVRDGTHDSPKYQSSGHPFITSKNVKNGFINYDDVQYISDEDFEEINKRSKVDINDILMGMIGTIGNTALIRTKPDFAIKNVALIKDTKQVNYLYLYHFLYSPFVEKQLSASMDGGTQKFIALGNIRNLDILFPGAEEQRRLGQYFSNLDNLITLHQSKFEKLQKIKKSCLQNLFPQNNQNTPKIRFKNFSDEWVEKKFGEIFKYERPDRFIVKNDEYDEKANTPVLTANKAFILGYTNENNTYNKESIIFDDFTLDCKYVDFPYMVKSSAIKILTIKNKEENNLKFAFESLNSTKFEVMGHARHYIAFIQNTATFVPNLAEQCKISEFFTKLDKLITLQQRKVEKLKEIKAAMLSKAFI
jgi:type I restriction enzyme S subunit